jgi:hypothetical protein
MISVARALVALGAGIALLGAAPPPAASAFLDAWAKIASYTCDIKVHEVKGNDVQDRTYRYAYLKPHFAKIDITGGPGRGGGAVWSGGDTVSGHQGGLLSGIHLKISIHDARAVDLRGDTIEAGSFQTIADELEKAPSATSSEETVDGVATDAITIPFSDALGATKRAIYLSRVTHLPVRRVTYQGDAIVKSEDFTNVDARVVLKESDFRG